mmetsp:Transcript_14043/g.16791  ORF Transcript_14043/g.16791 Transcript_14043/m.16791 type:complete len:85 (+) Transcript_14043:80-334(+)
MYVHTYNLNKFAVATVLEGPQAAFIAITLDAFVTRVLIRQCFERALSTLNRLSSPFLEPMHMGIVCFSSLNLFDEIGFAKILEG